MANKKELIQIGNDELFEKGNLCIIDEIFMIEYVVHAGGKNYKGHEFIRRFVKQLRSAIPDIRVVKVEFLLQSGDKMAWQRTFSGMHIADMMGIPPTEQKVEWRELVVSRFIGDKIVEEWVVSELVGELLSKSHG